MQLPKTNLYPEARGEWDDWGEYVDGYEGPEHARDDEPFDVPIISGAAGLTGRPPIRPVNDDLDHDIDRRDQGGPAIPGSCLRVLTSFRAECPSDCIGRQPEGGCLCDIVRAANEQGVAW
jgi:hypothetical protein